MEGDRGSQRKELPPLGLPPNGKRNRNIPKEFNVGDQGAFDYQQHTMEVKPAQKHLNETVKREKVISQAGSRRLDRQAVAGGSVIRASNKGSVTSDILDHLVDRVKRHEGSERRASRKGAASDVLGKLKIETDPSAREGSRRLNRIGLNNRLDHQFFSTKNSIDSLRSGFAHYDNSPVAKHYLKDPGFLMTFNGTIP